MKEVIPANRDVNGQTLPRRILGLNNEVADCMMADCGQLNTLLMQTRSHIITPPTKHGILINDFSSLFILQPSRQPPTSYLLCILSCPSRASKEDTRPWELKFISAKQALDCPMSHSFRYLC